MLPKFRALFSVFRHVRQRVEMCRVGMEKNTQRRAWSISLEFDFLLGRRASITRTKKEKQHFEYIYEPATLSVYKKKRRVGKK